MHMNDRKKNLQNYEEKLHEILLLDKLLLNTITMGVYRKDNEKIPLKLKAKHFLKNIVLQKNTRNVKTVSMNVHRNEIRKKQKLKKEKLVLFKCRFYTILF